MTNKQRRRTRTASAPNVRPRVADADALHASALAELAAGRVTSAEAVCRRALRDAPDHPPCLHLLGITLGVQGRTDLSLVPLRRATDLRPDVAEYHHNLGVALEHHGDVPAAIAAFTRAAEADPDDLASLRRLAELLSNHEQPPVWVDDRLDIAVSAFRRLLLDDPDDVRALVGLGSALEQQGRLRAAEVALRRARALDPRSVRASMMLGVVLRLLSRLDEAVECFASVVEIDPRHHGAMQNVGLTLTEMGRFDDASEWYERALLIAPDSAQVRFNRAISYLTVGRLHEGWDGFECGFEADQRSPDRKLAAPRWDGEDIADATVMLWREQGVGDELLLSSCFDDVIERAGHVIVECDPRLQPLFARSFPRATVRAHTLGPDGGETVDPPDYDVQIPFYSLPRLLRRDLDAFPRDRRAHLRADPAATARWRERIDGLGPGLKVGMAWRSRLVYGDRAWYYTKLGQWGPLFAVPGVHWILLQYDDCEREVIEAEDRFGIRIHRWRDIDLMQDLDDVAALTSALDLAVTPATSVGHMCGALGLETLQLEVAYNSTALGCRETYPWMPSVRLFPRNWYEGWERVIDDIAAELRRRTGGMQ